MHVLLPLVSDALTPARHIVSNHFRAELHSVTHSTHWCYAVHIGNTNLPNIAILCIFVQYGPQRCMCEMIDLVAKLLLHLSSLHTVVVKMNFSELHAHWDALVLNLLHGWWFCTSFHWIALPHTMVVKMNFAGMHWFLICCTGDDIFSWESQLGMSSALLPFGIYQ